MNEILRYQVPVIAWLILMIILSSLADFYKLGFGVKFEDKWEHFIVYTIFGLLLGRAIYHQNLFPKMKIHYFWATLAVGVSLGIADEFHQYFIPVRDADVYDLAANTVGIFFSMFIKRIYYAFTSL